MNFPRLETELKHSPKRVRKALVERELEPYFKKSGWLTQGSVARDIRWDIEPDGNLIGKLSYFRSKSLCVFQFRGHLEPSGTGTRVVLLAQHGPYSPLFTFLLYAGGLWLFGVGVVFSYLVDKAVQRDLLKSVQYLDQHLKMWDESARSFASISASIHEGNAHESTLPTSSVLRKLNPLVPDSVNGYPVPKEINAYPVVFVKTSDRIPWLRPGEVVLVLLGPPTLEEVISNVSLAEFAKTLPEGWTIQIVGGRGFSLEQMLNHLQELIERHQEYGPVHSGGPGPADTP